MLSIGGSRLEPFATATKVGCLTSNEVPGLPVSRRAFAPPLPMTAPPSADDRAGCWRVGHMLQLSTASHPRAPGDAGAALVHRRIRRASATI